MRHFDLIIIGVGSGNTILGPEFAELRVALVTDGPFGGTCLNAGCIPSKMLIQTARMADAVRAAGRYDIDASLNRIDWTAIRERVFGRIDPIAEAGREYRESSPDNANVSVIDGRAAFVDLKTIEVTGADGAERITADSIVIAAGARPETPPIPGLEGVRYLTSNSIMRIDEFPKSLTVLGGGFVGIEMSHLFAALGARVTLVARDERLIPREDTDVSDLYTERAGEYLDLRLGVSATEVSQDGRGVTLRGVDESGAQVSVTSEQLLVATGRTPNADVLRLAEAGYDVRKEGTLAVDEYQRALAGGEPVEGVWALGDICAPQQLKHVANAEARVVRNNLLAGLPGRTERLARADHRFLPHGVFGEPEVASVGLTEADARERCGDVVVARQDFKDVAYGWAMNDVPGFVKIVAREDGTLLGAHIIGPQAATLLQPLVQAMSTGQKARDIARTQYWLHPGMPEVVENALLQLTGEYIPEAQLDE